VKEQQPWGATPSGDFARVEPLDVDEVAVRRLPPLAPRGHGSDAPEELSPQGPQVRAGDPPGRGIFMLMHDLKVAAACGARIT
jgi:hypothetical protein